MTILLALPSPAAPLTRYLAERESQLSNPRLATSNPRGCLQGFTLHPSTWLQEQFAQARERNRLHLARGRRRVRRKAKRHQSKWPPLAGTGYRRPTFGELLCWELDGSLPDSDTSVLVAAADGEIGEGFHDGEAWRWASGGLVDGGRIAWAAMPEGPFQL